MKVDEAAAAGSDAYVTPGIECVHRTGGAIHIAAAIAAGRFERERTHVR
jgi:hypothetical protein